jgi:hypothetical protein
MMTTILRTILITLVLIAPEAIACSSTSIDVTPARPTSGDTIRLHAWGGCPDGCIPRDGQVSIRGNTITVSFDNSGGCILVPQPWGDRVEIGRLEPGTYTIVLTMTNEIQTREIGRKTLVVDPAPRGFEVLPRSGRAGTQVLLQREGLPSCAVMPCLLNVTFGGVPATVTAVRDGLLVVAPQHADGIVDIVVTDALGAVYTLPRAFRYGAADPLEQVQLFFPLAFAGAGANGAQWDTENLIRNRAPFAIAIDAGADLMLPAGGTTRLPNSRSEGGFVVRVARELERFLSYSSHVRDTSRAAQNLGTELPVLDADELDDEAMHITVPLDPRYRYTLRLFDLDATPPRPVEVIATGNEGRGTRVMMVPLQAPQCFIEPHCRKTWAAAAAVDLLQLFPHLAGATSVDLTVRVRGRSEDGRGWAFVSTTNNETQLVTTYSPKR